SLVRHPDVNHAATLPGRRGVRVAWIAEFGITLVLMSMVLITSNRASTAAYTGVIAGGLVALYITIEAPLSGMSMNPARTLGSAVHARDFRALWVYFTAPPLGMLCAAGLYVIAVGSGHVYCCKMSHAADEPCIFNCRIGEMPGQSMRPIRASGIQEDAASHR
ncbi:MAG: aquaporin, partial [Planctomycetota bacterium]